MFEKWKHKVSNRRFYLKLIITILTISIFPILIISVLSYFSSQKAMVNQLYDANIRYLKQTVNAVEIVMSQLDKSCKQLILDNTLKNFINYPESLYYEEIVGEFKDEDLPNLYKYLDYKRLIFEQLKSFKLSNEFINSVYIYDAKNNIILSSDGIQYKSNEFFDKEWTDITEKVNNWPFFSDIRLIKQNDGQPKKVLSIIYKLFDSDNIFIINLDAELLNKSIIEKLDTKTNNVLLILSDTGKMLLGNIENVDDQIIDRISNYERLSKPSDSFIEEYNKKKFMINYMTSSTPNWRFVSVIDLKNLYKGINSIIAIIMLTSILLLILTGLLAVISSRRIYKPIYSIIQYIKKRDPKCSNINVGSEHVGELNFIGNSLVNAFNEMENLQNRLKESLPAIKERFIYSIIRDDARSNLYDAFNIHEINEKINFLDIEIRTENLLLMVLEVEKSKALKINFEKDCINKLHIIDIVKNKFCDKYNIEVVEIEEDKFVIILNCNEVEIENILYYAHELNEELRCTLNIIPTIGVGQFCNDIYTLLNAYQEAEEALKYKIIIGCNEVIYINDVMLNYKQKFPYPKDMEIELNNFVRNGDGENALETFLKILNHIKTQGNTIHYNEAQQIFIQLLTSIINTTYELGLELENIFQDANNNLYSILLQKEDIMSIANYFKDIIYKISKYINEAYKEKNNRHVEHIMLILDNDCGNRVSLNTIAEQLHMNPSYISRLFKESTGKSFTEYLTNVRLEKSKKMLLETSLKVEEIGKKLGYNNSYYFIRLFKEYTGTTPGEYRKMFA